MPEPVADGAARLAAAGAGVPFVVYRDAEDRQRIVVLSESGATIGREPGLDIALGWDAEVSRLHARIEPLGSRWVVVDDGLSRNGTWVNGHRVTGRRRLEDGDTVRCGTTSMTFSAAHPLDGAAAMTVTAADATRAVQVSESQRRVLVALCRPFKGGARYATPPTNQQIADELHLSVDAVKTHLRALFARFGLEELAQNQKRARLVESALRLGVVSEHEL